jgi:serine protease Do
MKPMGRSWLVVAISAIAVTLGGWEPTGARAQYSRRTAIVEAVAKTRASIITVKIDKGGNGGPGASVAGTGVIIDGRGYVVTNRHVVASASRIYVSLEEGNHLEAEVVFQDARTDLAILRLEAGKTLPVLALGPGSDLMVGETVIAVGHPFGYTNSVSTGIISALGREITMPTGDTLGNLIQTNASINPGNSGGPLLNINGELIGINVALRDGAQGIAFAINVDTVKQVLSQHLSAQRVAGIHHGLTCAEDVIPEGTGRQRVVIEAVAEQTPAAHAGLRKGDQILRVANLPVSNRFDIERAFWDHRPGEKIALTVIRQGKEMNLGLTLTPASAASVVQR